MSKQSHQEIFKQLRGSVPGLQWKLHQHDETDTSLITASFLVHRFDGSQEVHPVARLSILEDRGDRQHYAVGFMQVVESFATHEMAIAWLLAKFRQFRVEEG